MLTFRKSTQVFQRPHCDSRPAADMYIWRCHPQTLRCTSPNIQEPEKGIRKLKFILIVFFIFNILSYIITISML